MSLEVINVVASQNNITAVVQDYSSKIVITDSTVRGPAGPQGPTGPAGATGPAGPAGPAANDAYAQANSAYAQANAAYNAANNASGNYGDANVSLYVLTHDVETKGNLEFIRDEGFGNTPYFGFVNPNSETLKLQTNISAGNLNTDVLSVDRQSQDVNFSGNIITTSVRSGGEYNSLELGFDATLTANGKLLQIRGGDDPNHIHLDTGNNSAYDQYWGDDSKYLKLSKDGDVVIRAWDSNISFGNTWTFAPNANLIFPDSTLQNTAYPGFDQDLNTTNNVTFGITTVGGLLTDNGYIGVANGDNLILSPSDGNVFVQLPGVEIEDGNYVMVAHEHANGVVQIKAGSNTWNFYANSKIKFPDDTTQTTAFTANPTVNLLNVKQVIETTNALSSATGTVTHNCAQGHIFIHSSISANFTANFTNITLNPNNATAFTLVLNQGATAYVPTAVQIANNAQTVNWQSGTQPAGNANKKDVVTFSVVNNNGTWITLGQLTSFG
jgi:hypothetical protein